MKNGQKWSKMAKNSHDQEGVKVGRSNATPTNFFSVDSYDLKTLSLNLAMIPSLLLKCQGYPIKGPLAK